MIGQFTDTTEVEKSRTGQDHGYGTLEATYRLDVETSMIVQITDTRY